MIEFFDASLFWYLLGGVVGLFIAYIIKINLEKEAQEE